MERGMQRRTELLLGNENLDKLQRVKVLIFGLGGVGSWCAEALVRSGIRNITIVDSDRVCVTNCNRQLMATIRTIGQVKVDALRERLLEIAPDANIVAYQKFYNADNAESFRMEEYDFIIDAIDSLKDKADMILRATSLPKRITFISSMGAALRTDPFKVRHSEFWKIAGDPLARALRKKFKRMEMWPARKFQCVYSEETPMENLGEDPANCCVPDDQPLVEDRHSKARINGSMCHVTAIFGMSIAGMVINTVIGR